MVYQAAMAVKIPVIGIGGITTLDDALEFFMAGASAIQIGTAVFTSPSVLPRLINGLGEWLDAQGLASLSEIVGAANPGFRGRNTVSTIASGME
jgi:dihydroorotate dehydrogenase (NAD+) catalytic subunit